MTTPSTVEVPLRTATAFWVEATTVRGFVPVTEVKEMGEIWRGSLREIPWNDEEGRDEGDLEVELKS